MSQKVRCVQADALASYQYSYSMASAGYRQSAKTSLRLFDCFFVEKILNPYIGPECGSVLNFGFFVLLLFMISFFLRCV